MSIVFSNACKIGTLVAIAAAAIIILVIIRSRSNSKCPETNQLLFKDDGQCYEKELQGPCNLSMVILPEEWSSPYGRCSCPYSLHERALLFHEASQRCYFIFSQGFCDDGEWLNVTRSGVPVCEPNRCLNHPDLLVPDGSEESDITNEIVPIKGSKCAVLGKPIDSCVGDEVVRFFSNAILPSCSQPRTHKTSYGAIGVPPSQCPLGSYPSIMGKCQPDFDFDFK